MRAGQNQSPGPKPESMGMRPVPGLTARLLIIKAKKGSDLLPNWSASLLGLKNE